jgi:hypothetical protein
MPMGEYKSEVVAMRRCRCRGDIEIRDCVDENIGGKLPLSSMEQFLSKLNWWRDLIGKMC